MPSSLDLPLSSSISDLHKFLNELLANPEELPYTFYFGAIEIKKGLEELVGKLDNWTAEQVLVVTYHPQAMFFVKPVTRWSSSLEGHTDAVRGLQGEE